MPPSNVPGLILHPYPMSTCSSPPSTYLLAASSNMSLLMSMPSHMYPCSVRIYPESAEPQPMSRMSAGAGRLSSSIHLSVMSDCMNLIRVLDQYLDASVSLQYIQAGSSFQGRPIVEYNKSSPPLFINSKTPSNLNSGSLVSMEEINPCNWTQLPKHDVQFGNRQFVRRLCSHVQQLCLTKTSIATISSMSTKYTQQLDIVSEYQSLFTEFFRQVLEFTSQIIVRLKKLDSKKFQTLIKRKLTDIFGCIMRYTYDIKMLVLADQANQTKRINKMSLSLRGLQQLIRSHSNVLDAFTCLRFPMCQDRRDVALWVSNIKRKACRLEHVLRMQQRQKKRVALHQWFLRVKEENIQTHKTVAAQVQKLTVLLMENIYDQYQSHQCIIQSIRELSGVNEIQFVKYSNNTFYQYSQQASHRSESQCSFATYRQKGFEATNLHRNCIDTNEMITESVSQTTSRLYIPLHHKNPLGLIVMTYQNAFIDWKEIQLLLNFCRYVAVLLKSIYFNQQRLEYYTHLVPTVSTVSKILAQKYLQYNPNSSNIKSFLDDVFSGLDTRHFQIGIVQNNKVYSLYNYSQLDRLTPIEYSEVELFTSDPSSQHGQYISVKRHDKEYIIVPMRENKTIKGIIKFTKFFQGDIHDVVDVIKDFVCTLTGKIKMEEEVAKGFDSTREIVTSGTIEQHKKWTEVLRSSTFDQLESAFQCLLNKHPTKLYGIIVWQQNGIRWTNEKGNLHFLQASDPLLPYLESEQTFRDSTLSPCTPLGTFIRRFPHFPDNRLYEYQNDNRNLVVGFFGNSVSTLIVAHYEPVVNPKESTHSSSIEYQIPYHDIVQFSRHLQIRCRGILVDDQYEGNPFVLMRENQLLCQLGKSNPSQVDPETSKVLLSNKRGTLRYACDSMYQGLLSKVVNVRYQQTNGKCYIQGKAIQLKGILQHRVQLKQQQLFQHQRNRDKKLRLLQLNLLVQQRLTAGTQTSVRAFKLRLYRTVKKKELLARLVQNNHHQKLGLIRAFCQFKHQWLMFTNIQDLKAQNVILLVGKIQKIFVGNVYQHLKRDSLKQSVRRLAIKQKLAQMARIKSKVDARKLKQTVCVLAQNKQTGTFLRKSQVPGRVHNLGLIMDKKISREYQYFFSCLSGQLWEFSCSISVIIEQIQLMMFRSYKCLLSFVQQRLCLCLQRMFDNRIDVTFNIQKSHQEENWQVQSSACLKRQKGSFATRLQGTEYLVCVIGRVHQSKAMVSSLQKLLMSMKVIAEGIHCGVLRRASLVCQSLTQFERSNQKWAMSHLFARLQACYKSDLTRSYSMAKQAEQKWALQQANQQANKENTFLGNKLQLLRSKTLASKGVIEQLQLQNKVKKKTLGTGMIQLRDLVSQQVGVDKEAGLQMIRLASDRGQGNKVRNLVEKLRSRGVKIVWKLMVDYRRRMVKSAFNKTVDYVFH